MVVLIPAQAMSAAATTDPTAPVTMATVLDSAVVFSTLWPSSAGP